MPPLYANRILKSPIEVELLLRLNEIMISYDTPHGRRHARCEEMDGRAAGRVPRDHDPSPGSLARVISG
jgi:hypothetical protein